MAPTLNSKGFIMTISLDKKRITTRIKYNTALSAVTADLGFDDNPILCELRETRMQLVSLYKKQSRETLGGAFNALRITNDMIDRRQRRVNDLIALLSGDVPTFKEVQEQKHWDHYFENTAAAKPKVWHGMLGGGGGSAKYMARGANAIAAKKGYKIHDFKNALGHGGSGHTLHKHPKTGHMLKINHKDGDVTGIFHKKKGGEFKRLNTHEYMDSGKKAIAGVEEANDSRRFQRGSGVFKCPSCNHASRKTGDESDGSDFCSPCYHIMSHENIVTDGGKLSKNEKTTIHNHLQTLHSKGGIPKHFNEIKKHVGFKPK